MTAVLAPGPQSIVLVYDGDCGICSASVRWLHARSEPGAIDAVASWGVTDPRVLAAPTADTVVVVQPDGAVLVRARAVTSALAHTRGAWRVLGRIASALLVVPPLRWLADLPYRAVAGNRVRLSAWLVRRGWLDDACCVPPRP